MEKGSFQLVLQTSSLVVGFMVWVILSSLMPYIQSDISLSSGEVAVVTAIPVILGSLLRVPIGLISGKMFFSSKSECNQRPVTS